MPLMLGWVEIGKEENFPGEKTSQCWKIKNKRDVFEDL